MLAQISYIPIITRLSMGKRPFSRKNCNFFCKKVAFSGKRRKMFSFSAGSPSPSLLTQCHLSQRERLWRNRTLCSSTGNYTAMPRALPLGELSPQVTERARLLPAERIPDRPAPALQSFTRNDTIGHRKIPCRRGLFRRSGYRRRKLSL